MATLLRRSILSSWVPHSPRRPVTRGQATGAAGRDEAAVKGWHVHGSGGRHQVATLLSLSPLTTLIASILSAHHGSHTIPSLASAWNACPSGRLSGPCTHGKMLVSSMASAHCLARLSGRCAAGVASTTSAAAF